MNREEVQLWSNSFNFSAGMLKKRPDAFTKEVLDYFLDNSYN
ncbi:hypothetical protein TREVI0001_1051 [Treponema vincentii ATCC 35580]|uniref:Uncharacterized protein n=1 Tax=Treponema vincentii ATCC 35580 TaxID=596324 RepID=C8PM18_9SPIR|nr:hypothetical protein TREVI0001_1051 [Treponema vincentii ATCC 35580]